MWFSVVSKPRKEEKGKLEAVRQAGIQKKQKKGIEIKCPDFWEEVSPRIWGCPRERHFQNWTNPLVSRSCIT